jgi:pimeloyl-ACP methyl ester carboxylesterase
VRTRGQFARGMPRRVALESQYVMLRNMFSSAAAGFDRAFVAAMYSRRRRPHGWTDVEALGHDERIARLRAVAEVYEREEYLAADGRFFPAPALRAFRTRDVRAFGRGGEVVDLTWPSAFEPYPDSGICDTYLDHPTNATAAARLVLHGDRPRPAVVLIHGYLGGAYLFEERVWPLAWLFERGLDVALAVLPFHGVRARPGEAVFPSSDIRVTIEGFRQAVGDLRALVAYLHARGSRAVGAMGMSLGGYTTGLLATVEPGLAFAVPMIPLVSLADFARDAGRLVGTASQVELQHAAVERAYRVISPLARPSRVAPSRTLIIAGEGDRVTPMRHAERLAEHFDARLERFHGGHLLQFGRGGAFRAVGRMLGQLGLLEG